MVLHIGGVAVNHWAAEQMVTRDVDLVIALDAVDRVVGMLAAAGFTSKRFAWSVNLRGRPPADLLRILTAFSIPRPSCETKNF